MDGNPLTLRSGGLSLIFHVLLHPLEVAGKMRVTRGQCQVTGNKTQSQGDFPINGRKKIPPLFNLFVPRKLGNFWEQLYLSLRPALGKDHKW